MNAQGGSSGGIQVRDAEFHLDAIPNATWFTARNGPTLVGAYALVPRGWGHWRCHMTVRGDDPLQTTRALVDAARAHVGDQPIAGACEASHVVLRQVLEDVGFDVLAETAMLVWSRRQSSTNVRPATAADRALVEQRTTDRPVHRQEPLPVERSWVLERDGTPVAGTYVHPLAWHVDSLGPGSRITLPLLRLAGLQLQPLQFAGFLGTFGAARDVAELWAGVLAATGLQVALVGADVEDPRWTGWTQLSRGTLGRALGLHHAVVYGSGDVPRPVDWTEGFLR